MGATRSIDVHAIITPDPATGEHHHSWDHDAISKFQEVFDRPTQEDVDGIETG
jgi:hypothetical protein